MGLLVMSDGLPVKLDTRLWSFDSTFTPWAPNAYVGATEVDPLEMWRCQPAVRTVVGFLARNIAQVPLHGFRRSGSDRDRLPGDAPLSTLLEWPGRMVDPITGRIVVTETAADAAATMVTDVCLFDRAASRIVEDGLGPTLVRLPPNRWYFKRDGMGRPMSIVLLASDGSTSDVPLSECLWLDGYPVADSRWTSQSTPMQALAATLAEDAESAGYRRDLWRNQGRFGGWIERPADAPAWSTAARDGFRTGWQRYASGGTRAGATPILEDGMKFHESTAGITPESAQQLESRKFSIQVVAAAFHLPPMFVGLLDGANYSNVEPFREILYSDTLGPWFQRVAQAWNARVLTHPVVDAGPDDFVEHNVAEKLRMGFEAQARIFQTTTGGPIMTRNEARRRLNLPELDGADDLIVPLNVLTGGQASPTDSGTQNEGER